MTIPPEPPIVPPTPTADEIARVRLLIAEPANVTPYTDAELTTLMQQHLCVKPKIDPYTRLPFVDAWLRQLLDVHLDLYGAAADAWETKAITVAASEIAAGGRATQERNGDVQVTLADDSGSKAMRMMAARMRRKSCDRGRPAETPTLLPPSTGYGYRGVGDDSTLAYSSTYEPKDPVPIGELDPAVINGPPILDWP